MWIWVFTLTAGLVIGLIGTVFFKDISLLFGSLAYAAIASILFQLAEWFAPIISKSVSVLFSKITAHAKRHRQIYVGIVLMLVGIRLIIPCPLGGNWYGKFIAHMCDDHAFLRFADGKVFNYHGELKPFNFGSYERIGWNKYALKFGPDDKKPWVIHSGWFFFVVEMSPGDRWWFHRDFHVLEAQRMI